MKTSTPAVWIMSDAHVDIWVHHGFNLDPIDVSLFHDPTVENVYLILGDSLNGLRKGNLNSQKWLYDHIEKLSLQGKVYFVLGNHEFYNGDFVTAFDRFSEWLEDLENVTVVCGPKIFAHGDTALILSTNWPAMSEIEYITNMTDINAFITYADVGGILPIQTDVMEKLGALNKADMIECSNIINFLPDHFKNLVVGTHFATVENPSQRELYPKSNPYFDPKHNAEFIDNCLEFKNKRGGELVWCYGHSHINETMESGYGGRIVTNQIGYPSEAVKRNVFQPFHFLKVK